MKKIFNLIVLIFHLTPSSLVWAHGAGAATVQANVGTKYAVQAFDPSQGFQLAARSQQRLQIKWQAVATKKDYIVSKDSVVWEKNQTFVFRRRQAWFQPVPIQIKNISPGFVQISSPLLQTNDGIVTQGAALLRVIQMDLGISHEEEHHHGEHLHD